jgi:hypothetical protein
MIGRIFPKENRTFLWEDDEGRKGGPEHGKHKCDKRGTEMALKVLATERFKAS